MSDIDVTDLTRRLIAFNTVNPPGREAPLAEFVAELLTLHGFKTSLYTFEENRLHLIAEKGVTPELPALVFSGHFDTVPLGSSTMEMGSLRRQDHWEQNIRTRIQ